MNVIKVAILLAGILSLMPILTKAASDDCLSHAELIETDSRELTAESACDDIGRAYVMGVKGMAIGMQDDKILDGYTYYLMNRLFLLEEQSASGIGDKRSAYMQLLVASMLLLDGSDYLLESVARASDIRKKYYLAFVLNKYWEYTPLNTIDSDTVQNARNNLLIETPLSGFEISCFIKSDIPTLSVEQIFNSAQYADCLTEN